MKFTILEKTSFIVNSVGRSKLEELLERYHGVSREEQERQQERQQALCERLRGTQQHFLC